MKKLLLILLFLPFIGFGQFRWNVDETIKKDNIVYLKTTMKPITGIVYTYAKHLWGQKEQEFNIREQRDYVNGKECGKYYEVFGNVINEGYKGQEFIVVEVSQSNKPIFMKVNGKEEFYVRHAASSRPYSMSEATHYINKHWK